MFGLVLRNSARVRPRSPAPRPSFISLTCVSSLPSARSNGRESSQLRCLGEWEASRCIPSRRSFASRRRSRFTLQVSPKSSRPATSRLRAEHLFRPSRPAIEKGRIHFSVSCEDSDGRLVYLDRDLMEKIGKRNHSSLRSPSFTDPRFLFLLTCSLQPAQVRLLPLPRSF